MRTDGPRRAGVVSVGAGAESARAALTAVLAALACGACRVHETRALRDSIGARFEQTHDETSRPGCSAGGHAAVPWSVVASNSLRSLDSPATRYVLGGGRVAMVCQAPEDSSAAHSSIAPETCRPLRCGSDAECPYHPGGRRDRQRCVAGYCAGNVDDFMRAEVIALCLQQVPRGGGASAAQLAARIGAIDEACPPQPGYGAEIIRCRTWPAACGAPPALR